MPSTSITSVTAEDQGTAWLEIPAGQEFDLNLGSSGAGTVTLQRRKSSAPSTIYDVKDYAAGSGAAEMGYSATGWEFRLYVKTGNFTSGPIDLALWRT